MCQDSLSVHYIPCTHSHSSSSVTFRTFHTTSSSFKGLTSSSIRERYPLTSQLITENRIPEFGQLAPFSIYQGRVDPSYIDNLYLDFNGIIHNCKFTIPSQNWPLFNFSQVHIQMTMTLTSECQRSKFSHLFFLMWTSSSVRSSPRNCFLWL